MPKLIDNYVLSRRIGAGQYGEVFQGYDRANNCNIAVKSIKRDSIKGKFRELLQSQIKVLRGCESSNIIKLYDLKKTNNNFYLIMQYCCDGDMEAYLRKRKYLTEDQAIGILCQIIHGFQHLYKHKILHRDLKLANLLRNDGIIKIADFGFSKILSEEQFTKTILGSPLNMAPEVLENSQYTNKVDIYSLGVCFYWILFGRPPFNAKNVIDLKKIINKQEIEFPTQINKISSMSKQLITSMLKVNPKQRISWQQLFEHEINSHLTKKMENQLKLTLTMDGNITENICKLYLNQNLVIIHSSEFKKKNQVVDYVVRMVKDGKKEQFKGEVLKKEIDQNSINKNLKREVIDDGDKINSQQTEDEKIIDAIQQNTFFLLNQRNKIIFLLSVMNDFRSKSNIQKGLLLYCLTQLTKKYYQKFELVLRDKKNQFELPYWKESVDSPAFYNLEHFLVKEKSIMHYELSKSEEKMVQTKQKLNVLVRNYAIGEQENLKKTGLSEKSRPQWIHLCHLMDIVHLDSLMTQDFDFKHYYCDFGKYEIKQLIEVVQTKIKTL